MSSLQQDRAQTFHALHRRERELLLLPNAWDAGSALLMQSLGPQALATSSAAVAWALGYGDGDRLPFASLLSCVANIVRGLRVPLTVDIEGGYADEPLTVGAHVAALIGVGVVGINIEDGRAAPELLCRKIEAARAAADAVGVRLFINARTDVYLKGLAPPEQRVAESLARAALYERAGADGIFVAGARDAQEIAALVAGTLLPLNILALAGVPATAELARLGVRRLSAGSGIAEAVYGRMAQLTEDFLQTGDGGPFSVQAIGYATLNGLMNPPA